MVKVNFSSYAKYVTDSIYQWDLNRMLNIKGLNLAVAPEIHFSNANIDRAIVRQASLKNNVVSVQIPNSLLQEPLTVYAHVGIYDGDEFKVVEVISLPVIPRKRPTDYRLTTNDEEFFSFNKLENQINEYQAIIDNKIKLNKLSATVVFSNTYKNANGQDFISSSLVPLINAMNYSEITLGTVKILGTTSDVGTSRFNISKYGTGFSLNSTDSMAVQTVAGKAVSFEFTLTE